MEYMVLEIEGNTSEYWMLAHKLNLKSNNEQETILENYCQGADNIGNYTLHTIPFLNVMKQSGN